MTIKLQNKAAYFGRMNSITRRLKDELSQVNGETAKEMVEIAQAFASSGDSKLRSSIQALKGRPRRGAFTVVAGGIATTIPSRAGPFDYAISREYGDVLRKARPFFWPAFRAVQRPYRREVAKAMRRAFGAF